MIWSSHEIVFQHLVHNEIFFFEYALACYFFRPRTFCRIFFCVDGVEKVGIPLLLLATLAAVLFNSNRGLILAFVRFNSTAEQIRPVANVPNNPFVMHSYLTIYIVMPFTFTYVPRTITGYTVYIYVNCRIHSYSLKDIYPRLAFL